MPPNELPWRSISWKVTEECNYRCSYCLQPSYSDNYPEDLDLVINCVNESLPEKFEIKIAGGEIFADTEKAKILAKSLTGYGHWISICTNLSAPTGEYLEFLQATAGKFYTFGASLHLEYADPFDFLGKCREIRSKLPPYSKIQVHNVITRGPDTIKRLGEIKKRFEDEGNIFYTDLLVDKRGKYLEYTKEEYRLIEEILGPENRLVKHQGNPCRAGDSYFALLPNLDVWVCWDAYLSDEKSMYLGNMLSGTFEFSNRITICPFDTCSCPTPVFKHKYKLTNSGDRNAGM